MMSTNYNIYKPNKLVSNAELQFYNYMKNNLVLSDKIEILIKVRVGDLVKTDMQTKEDIEAYNKIAKLHVDFLVCEKDNLNIICAIELDDYSHIGKEQKDEFKASVLSSVGINTIRIRAQVSKLSIEDIEKINNCIYKYFTPMCPICNSRMSFIRSNINNRDTYYKCNNKNCEGYIPMESTRISIKDLISFEK